MLCELPQLKFFTKPTEKNIYAEFHEIFKQPIFTTDVKSKYMTGKYENTNDFLKDIEQIGYQFVLYTKYGKEKTDAFEEHVGVALQLRTVAGIGLRLQDDNEEVTFKSMLPIKKVSSKEVQLPLGEENFFYSRLTFIN